MISRGQIYFVNLSPTQGREQGQEMGSGLALIYFQFELFFTVVTFARRNSLCHAENVLLKEAVRVVQ